MQAACMSHHPQAHAQTGNDTACTHCLYTHTQIVLEVRKTKMLDQQLVHVNDALGTTRNLMGGINTAKEQSITVQVWWG